ncbi:Crp/Fnr family transcriptional regulator [Phenylobacterium sp. LjRoot164]|uniref:Crp/Fnr family transcriptional regulator n=1 Tax=unclassified Phenylobacterium TaxID=2640670 RepID=UPI003ECFFF76
MTDDRRLALEVLHAAGWLAPYGPGLADALLAEGQLARLGAGRWAQAEGDEETGLLVVIEGAVDLYCQAPGDREVRFSQAGPGGALGQSVAFGGGPRIVTAVCAQPSLLLRVSDAGLERIARTRPEIWRALAALVYLQLRGAVRQAAEAVALPPRQRLASRLLVLARSRRGPPRLALSQQALAEMVGLSRKTVNGLLVEFARERLIGLDYGAVEVLDLRRLERVAES